MPSVETIFIKHVTDTGHMEDVIKIVIKTFPKVITIKLSFAIIYCMFVISSNCFCFSTIIISTILATLLCDNPRYYNI